MQDDDHVLDTWESMSPVGREWGAPDAENLWALDAAAYRLQGTRMALVETEAGWCLSWDDRELARWPTSTTDWRALREVVAASGDPRAIQVWNFAIKG